MNMLHSLRVAMLSAIILLAAAAGVHAQTATVDDTAKFLAGMMPSADSPLMPLTNETAWQRHAKFFDTRFRPARAAPDVADSRMGRRQSVGAKTRHVLHVLRP